MKIKDGKSQSCENNVKKFDLQRKFLLIFPTISFSLCAISNLTEVVKIKLFSVVGGMLVGSFPMQNSLRQTKWDVSFLCRNEKATEVCLVQHCVSGFIAMTTQPPKLDYE